MFKDETQVIHQKEVRMVQPMNNRVMVVSRKVGRCSKRQGIQEMTLGCQQCSVSPPGLQFYGLISLSSTVMFCVFYVLFHTQEEVKRSCVIKHCLQRGEALGVTTVAVFRLSVGACSVQSTQKDTVWQTEQTRCERKKFSCTKICKILIFFTYKCVLQKTSVHSRLGVIYNPTSKINEENTAISRGVLAAFLTQKNSFLRNFLRKLAKEETATAIYSGEKIKTFLTEVSSYLFGIISILCIFRKYKPVLPCY